MGTILIDPHVGIGHVNSTIKIAKLLRAKGHRVIYTGERDLFSKPIEMGFEFYEHNPVFMSEEEIQKSIKKRKILFENLFQFIEDSRYKKIKIYIDEFYSVIRKINPDIVLLDEESFLKYFLYKKLNIPFICFQTMMVKSREKNNPPFSSRYCPVPNSLLSVLIVNWIWDYKLLKKFLKIQIKSLTSFRQNNFSLHIRLIKELGYRLKDYYSFSSSFNLCLKAGPVLNLAPFDLDFPRTNRPGLFGIGPLKDLSEETDLSSDPRFESLYLRVKKWKEDNNRFIVFCSLGTVTSKYSNRLNLFFKKMKKVAILNSGMQFIFSVSKHFNIDELYPIPGNVNVFSYLPQNELLKHCHIMVTHGGINSITECIFNEVPMLVYPLSAHWDQPGNSARIIYHNLGLRGRIKFDSAGLISKKIRKLKEGYSSYLRNIILMKKKFEIKNRSEEAIEIIETHINNTSCR